MTTSFWYVYGFTTIGFHHWDLREETDHSSMKNLQLLTSVFLLFQPFRRIWKMRSHLTQFTAAISSDATATHKNRQHVPMVLCIINLKYLFSKSRIIERSHINPPCIHNKTYMRKTHQSFSIINKYNIWFLSKSCK